MMKFAGRRASWLRASGVAMLAWSVVCGPGVAQTVPRLVWHRNGPIIYWTIPFAPESATLRPMNRMWLDSSARYALSGPPRKVLILGYSDMSRSDAESITLSQKRAEAVAAVLVSYGVPRSEMIVKGEGKADPPIVAGRGFPPQCGNRVTLQVWFAGEPRPPKLGRYASKDVTPNC